MTDIDTKARRCMKRKIAHRAAQLRKTADELDALAAELDPEDREPTSGVNEMGPC